MSVAIGLLKDNFENNVIDPLWINGYVPSGSATRAETGGQARFTLPSSTAGSHNAGYQTSATYDLTGDQVSINVDTMVSTSVAASASFYIFDSNDATSWIRFIQLSGTLSFQKSLAGVTTAIGSNVTWSASTHKYWRIRESGGTIYLDTSTNGTSWTNRASATTALSFVPTAVIVRIDATCGNVAAPGSFRVEELNAVYPAPSATWRETTADWSITNRLRPVTLASDGGKHGVIVTADTMDSSRALGGTVRYFAGPLGSSSGGYLALTEYASLALAQASAFPIPVDGRVDLPELLDARFIRLYHRSNDASAHVIYEYVPRRIVQADDIEAESIRAINIAAGAITADKIFVLQLSAITADMGSLTAGTITGALIQTAASGARVALSSAANGGAVGYGGSDTYDVAAGTGTYQVLWKKTDGKLYAGAGVVLLDANGVGITGPSFSYGLYNASPVTTPRVNMIQWSKSSGSQAASILGSASAQLLMLADKITLAIPLNSSDSYGLNLQASGAHSMTADTFAISFGGATGPTTFQVQTAASTGAGSVDVKGGLNVGSSASGAANGQISTSGNVGIGEAVNSVTRLHVKGASSSGSDYAFIAINSSGTAMIIARNDNRLGFFGNTEVARPTVTGSRGGNAALASLLTALQSLGLVVDSSS